MMNIPILIVEDLWKTYAGIDAVQGLTFEISRGEFFGLLGPNGAGKTTTIGILSGPIEVMINQIDRMGRERMR